MTNPFRTDLIAIFIRRGHKGKEIVEMVREIEALIDGQRCEWTKIKGRDVYTFGCCKQYEYITEGGLKKHPFCPCCGKRIEVKNGQG